VFLSLDYTYVPTEDVAEIPLGPCASFHAPGGQRYAIYEPVRPDALRYFDCRFDE
jgi:hypothetical protein